MIPIEQELRLIASSQKAGILGRFFQTGPGQYGEGDRFLGVTVPGVRALAKRYANQCTFREIEDLLQSEWHEVRMTAVLILVDQYEHCKDSEKRRDIFEFYVANASRLNNWDFVDLSSPRIFGAYLLTCSTHEANEYFDRLVVSSNLWERRVAIVGTFAFLKQANPHHTLRLAKKLLTDRHPLIHKATGWMLRELGKRCSREELLGFVDEHWEQMPRTMLRYALEHLPKDQYREYLMRGRWRG